MGKSREDELLDEIIYALQQLQNEGNNELPKKEGRRAVLRKVTFQDPTVTIEWSDGIDTKYREKEGMFNPQKGFEYCILKKMIGEKSFNAWRETCKRLANKTGLSF